MDESIQLLGQSSNIVRVPSDPIFSYLIMGIKFFGGNKLYIQLRAPKRLSSLINLISLAGPKREGEGKEKLRVTQRGLQK